MQIAKISALNFVSLNKQNKIKNNISFLQNNNKLPQDVFFTSNKAHSRVINREFHSNGQLAKEEYRGGFVKSYDEDGNLAAVCHQNGSSKEYYPNGKLKREISSNGMEVSYFPNQKIESLKTPDGHQKFWNKKGVLVQEFEHGTIREWYPDGKMSYEFLDGVVRTWHKNGQIASEEDINTGVKTTWNKKGKILTYRNEEGSTIHYDGSGNVSYITRSDRELF